MDIKNNHFNKLYLSNTLNCSYIAVTNKTENLCENLFVEKNFVQVRTPTTKKNPKKREQTQNF